MAYNVKQKGNTRNAPGTPLYRRLLALRGLYSRVAKKENVSRQFVHQVSRGLRRSKRIEAAIAREAQRIERELARAEREEKETAA